MQPDITTSSPKRENISVQSLILNKSQNLKERNLPEIEIGVQQFEVMNDPGYRMFLHFSVPIFC